MLEQKKMFYIKKLGSKFYFCLKLSFHEKIFCIYMLGYRFISIL